MSFANPAHRIQRVSVVTEEAEWVKMFDPQPVGASPPLPEPLTPTDPVPEVMEALGLSSVSTAHTRNFRMLRALTVPTWDGLKNLVFYGISDEDAGTDGVWPGPTIRIPRGVVFHSESQGAGPPPHTFHWHGIEPTPINDGVGHCSMEIGSFLYQFQPNFIGSYFYHCHRNTMQHFEFGLYGNLFIVPPDAYFASVVGADWRTQTLPAEDPRDLVLNPAIPVGAGIDGLFRIAANVAAFPQFSGFVSGDPRFGVAGALDAGVGDPHAFTVPYDVEVMWVLDDHDSVWSDLASDARATFPAFGPNPGVDDNFARNPGLQCFFAFNDYRADYFFVTGVQFQGHVGDQVRADIQNPATIFGTPDGTIPAVLNSGVSGTQVAVNARVGQTILIRCLDAAYGKARVSFPVDVVIIAWDGRALGVPPFGSYSHAYLVPANTPIDMSTARRFDALIRPTATMNSFVNVDFINTRGDDHLLSGRIPFTIRA